MSGHCRPVLRCAWAIALLGVTLSPLVEAGGVVTINLPWMRPAPLSGSTEVYLEARSSDEASLSGARSALAGRVTLLAPGKGATPVAAIPLPAGVAVALAPSGYRLRLAQLARPLKVGERVPLVLTLRGADGSEREIAITAEVRRRSAADDHRRGHAH